MNMNEAKFIENFIEYLSSIILHSSVCMKDLVYEKLRERVPYADITIAGADITDNADDVTLTFGSQAVCLRFVWVVKAGQFGNTYLLDKIYSL